MASDGLRMRLRKRSSTGGSMDCEPRSPTTEVLGRTRLTLPDTCGRSCFHLATHWTGQGSLRHYLSGLNTLERRYREVELLMVSGTKVKGWSHSAVTSCLQQHLSHVTSVTQCKLILRATDHCGLRHVIEVQFELLYDDGVSVGDKARAAFDVIIRVIDNVITTPDITDVMYEKCCYIRIRHGALTACFLRVGRNDTLCMDESGSPDDYVFKCFNFFGHNMTVCRRRGRGRCPRRCRGGGGGGGDGDGSWPVLCVLQQPRTCRYVVASPMTSRLKADNDGTLHTDIQTIQKPDPRFFVMHQSGNGGPDQFCLRPLMLCNHFLRYDAVSGLTLERCDPPPFQDPAVVRYFSFDFMPANTHGH